MVSLPFSFHILKMILFDIILAFVFAMAFSPWGYNVVYFLIYLVIYYTIYKHIFGSDAIDVVSIATASFLGWVFGRVLMGYKNPWFYVCTEDD